MNEREKIDEALRMARQNLSRVRDGYGRVLPAFADDANWYAGFLQGIEEGIDMTAEFLRSVFEAGSEEAVPYGGISDGRRDEH